MIHENCALLGYYIVCRPMKMGPIGWPETSVRYYCYMLRNSPEERGLHQLHGGSLKSCIVILESHYWSMCCTESSYFKT